MNYKVSVHGQGRYHYYLQLNSETDDEKIAAILHISLASYHEALLTQFKSYLSSLGIYFYSKKEAEKAVEWLESQIMVLELAGIGGNINGR